MTRSKKTPSLHKPSFDEESALSFAEMAPKPSSGAPEGGSRKGEAESEKGQQAERLSITLLLKAETVATLRHEAGRKGKEVAQVVEKLVAKHLGKNK